MPKHLKHKEFIPFAPEHTGTIRINHVSDDCSGESKSMYIERYSNGDIYAYCHRCSKLGRYRSPYLATTPRPKGHHTHSPSSIEAHSRVEYFDRALEEWGDWPTGPRRWLKQYGISEREVKDNGIRFNPDCNLLFFPLRGGSGTACTQSRNFGTNGARYYTDIYPDSCPYHLVLNSSRPNIVLVEDIVSAIKVGRFRDTCATLGTNPKDCCIAWLVKNYENFVIWYDDDNPHVKKSQRVLRNRLAQVGTARIVTGMGKDPKECSEKEIKEALWI